MKRRRRARKKYWPVIWAMIGMALLLFAVLARILRQIVRF